MKLARINKIANAINSNEYRNKNALPERIARARAWAGLVASRVLSKEEQGIYSKLAGLAERLNFFRLRKSS